MEQQYIKQNINKTGNILGLMYIGRTWSYILYTYACHVNY